MIDLNDRFIGLMVGLLILLVFAGYLAFFSQADKKR